MIKRRLAFALALVISGTSGVAAAETQTIRFGWCAKTISSAAAPFAIAQKMGWFEKDGIRVELVPLPGSTDCMKFVATKELQVSLPSAEPLAIIRPQGVKAKFFYTAYQGFIYGIAVPDASPIKTFADLKGKKVGVTSMASAAVIVVKALAKHAGMDPEKDISIVVAGEAAQTAALLRSNQIDALAQFDTQFALTQNAGTKLRILDLPQIKNFPSNGFVALEDYIKSNRAQMIALGRGYAMGTAWAMANPEAAIRILWEVYPQTRATGKDEATALRDDLLTLEARIKNWRYEPVGAKHWGESVEKNYQEYLDWLLAQDILKNKTDVKDIVTNELVAEINKFDAAALAAQAKAYKAK